MTNCSQNFEYVKSAGECFFLKIKIAFVPLNTAVLNVQSRSLPNFCIYISLTTHNEIGANVKPL